jgi:hypothetical protein
MPNENLCVLPEIHFRNHVISGRKLDIGNAEACPVCFGFGWGYISGVGIDNFLLSVTSRLSYEPTRTAVAEMCNVCNGSGRRES